MMELPAWTLDDLLARYELEPGLDDVFVEGAFDVEVYGAVFDGHSSRARVLYPSGSFSIDESDLQMDGLTFGAKQQLIYLARRLAGLSVPPAGKCVVDRDLDHWFGPLESNSHLCWTPVTAIETFFWTDSILDKLLTRWAAIRVTDRAALCDSAAEVLVDLYALRLADRELAAKLEWPEFTKYLSRVQDRVVFDRDGYLGAIVSRNGRGFNRTAILEASERWLRAMSGTVNQEVRGRDIPPLLAWIVRRFHGAKACGQRDAVERVLVVLAPELPELVRFVTDI